MGTERKKRRGNAQIYHFLLGDPGMCSYTDKVIKQLEPLNIKKMKDWNKKFVAPYSGSELETLRQLSLAVDALWDNQIKLRQTVEAETRDALTVFGQADAGVDSHTTIRQKDLIYSKLYKSEHMKNAGPYARLKFAMDYWCALWFWPIDKADMLPSRSEFFNDLNLILEGTFSTKGNSNMLKDMQLNLFPTAKEEIVAQILKLFPGQTTVDIDNLCTLFPRLALVREIATQNHFMHWELEFADVFAERGGFDLVIGNPPWVRIEWKEQGVLADKNPMFAVKKLTATQTAHQRESALCAVATKALYFSEYESISGEQAFLNAVQNYPLLIGMKANLYKCFLPLAWENGNKSGVSAFVHPDGVYDDPKGGVLREELYRHLRQHVQYENELNLFEGTNDHGRMRFSTNIYKNGLRGYKFEIINNIFTPLTVEECYDSSIKGEVPGIKDENGNWNVHGHPDRVIHVGEPELRLFAKLFDGSEAWKQARLPVLHAKQLVDVLERFAAQPVTLGDKKEQLFYTQMWNETNAQKDGTIAGLSSSIFS